MMSDLLLHCYWPFPYVVSSVPRESTSVYHQVVPPVESDAVNNALEESGEVVLEAEPSQQGRDDEHKDGGALVAFGGSEDATGHVINVPMDSWGHDNPTVARDCPVQRTTNPNQTRDSGLRIPRETVQHRPGPAANNDGIAIEPLLRLN